MASPKGAADKKVQKKLTKWAAEPTVMDLKNDLQAAKPAHDAHVINVKKWNDLRNVTGSAQPKKVTGRSSIQPKLIRRQAEWRYSALSEAFLASEDLFKVSPQTFEDEAGAKQNELLINWQFRTKLNKVNFIDQLVHVAVDEGTVIVRLGWERITTFKKTMKPVFQYTELNLQDEVEVEECKVIKQAIQMKQMNPRGFNELPEDLQAATEYTLEKKTLVSAKQVGEAEVDEEVVIKNDPMIQIMDPDNIFIDPSCEGDIEKAQFVIVSYETSKAQLLKDGRFKNLTHVNWSANTVLSQPDHATQMPTDFNFKDDLRKRVVAYEYWGFYDVDGKEELKPIVATWIGDTMIRMEQNPFPDGKLPFVVVPYLPVKRALYGEPDAEILEDNQRVMGAVTRGMIDLMGRSANAQQGMAKNFLDVVNRRRFERGMDYEYNPGTGDPRLSVYQHTYPEIPNSAMTMVQMQNFEAEALTGVKSFSGGLSGQAYGDVATGIKGMLDAASKREMNILRRLAKGVRDIGAKVMAMNAVFLSEKEVVRVTNKVFITVRREELAGNYDLIVDISTPEVDAAKSQDLSFMLQTMGPDMAPMMSQRILSEIATLKRMPVLANDIMNFQPPPNPMKEELEKLAMAKAQIEVQKLQKEIEKIDSEIAKNYSDAAKSKIESDLNSLEFVEQESGVHHARSMEKISEQSRANQDLAVTKALLDKRKPEETKPDIEAAVGYNRLTDLSMSRV